MLTPLKVAQFCLAYVIGWQEAWISLFARWNRESGIGDQESTASPGDTDSPEPDEAPAAPAEANPDAVPAWPLAPDISALDA
jgi:hypothetical protein